MPVLTATDLRFGYVADRLILDGIDLAVEPGQRVALVGPSGSGKSTVLGLVAGVLGPTSGQLMVGDLDMEQARHRRTVRRGAVAWVQQTTNLLPERDACENVALGMRARGMPRGEARRQALVALDAVGLADQSYAVASTLSGGQAQRVCVARALACAPMVLLADEPTGQLDAETSGQVMAAMLAATRAFGTTLLLATHDMTAAQSCDVVHRMQNGRLVS